MVSTGSGATAAIQESVSSQVAWPEASPSGMLGQALGRLHHWTRPAGTNPAPGPGLRWLAVVLMLVAIGLGVVALVTGMRSYARDDAAVELRMTAERLARSALLAADGQAPAFAAVREQAAGIDATLARFDPAARAADTGSSQGVVVELARQWAAVRTSVEILLGEQASLVESTASLRALNDHDADLLESTEQVVALLAQAGGSTRDQAAAARMALLTQRIAKNANLLLAASHLDAEAAYGLSRDTGAFQELLRGLAEGNDAVRVAALRMPALRKQLDALREDFAVYHRNVTAVVGRLQYVARGRTSARALAAGAEAIVAGTERLRATQRSGAWVGIVSAGAALACMLGAFGVAMAGGRRRAAPPPAPVPEADPRPFQELAQRIRELHGGDVAARGGDAQALASGIADWIGYATLETRQLAAALEQSRMQLRVVGDEMLHRTGQLIAVAREQAGTLGELAQAAQSTNQLGATVGDHAAAGANAAARSIDAATFGAEATRDAIRILQGVHGRGQESLRRVQGISASLQELSDMVAELSRSSVQLEVVALNTAIRASTAAPSGRGTAVLAEEVERYAQRATEATRHLAAIIERGRVECQREISDTQRDTEVLREQTCVADDTLQALLNLELNAREFAGHLESIAAAAAEQKALAVRLDEGTARASGQTDVLRERAQSIAEAAGMVARAGGEAPQLPVPLAQA